ncbi:anti-sigma factor [Pedobacter sp. KBW06]|uniref:FecR family protein n=1 Tax=Pedobacter sp. KBW06 TaxID=2153359 RepID=UPI000F59C573|nr:FecR domain-containing protein [Pedobacter sp. KBW06]RQO75105.1 anti-sigma factor [Pedobacter sp. KBW06]
MKKATDLLDKYNSGIATDEEKVTVESWYLKYKTEATDLSQQKIEQEYLLGLEKLTRHMDHSSSLRLWPRMVAAAVLFFVLGIGIFFVFRPARQQERISYRQNEIGIGGNRAVLTLADGRNISLTDAVNGTIAEEPGIKVTKTRDGQLLYTLSGKPSAQQKVAYNTITTPKGGQYQVILPDGTRVWLNAASSLEYPTAFSAAERKVVLKGEAYFEVARQFPKKVPFIVQTDRAKVEVLGTHFNVNAYDNEPFTKTTLLEGKVSVSYPESAHAVVLTPDQQAWNDKKAGLNTAIRVITVDPEFEIAWKKGWFMFNDERIESIMRKISRWYDVEVVYEGKITAQQVFGGTVNRFENVSKVLEMLELTNAVHFKIEGRKITVMP